VYRGEAEIRRLSTLGQPGQKVNETPCQSRRCVPVIPAMWDAVGRRIRIQGQSRLKCETIPKKLLKSKRAWVMAQVVEHLPSKHKILSSAKKIKKVVLLPNLQNNFNVMLPHHVSLPFFSIY
jgi:hypothetical protein